VGLICSYARFLTILVAAMIGLGAFMQVVRNKEELQAKEILSVAKISRGEYVAGEYLNKVFLMGTSYIDVYFL